VAYSTSAKLPWIIHGGSAVDPEKDRRRGEHAEMPGGAYRFEWRGAFDNASVNALHAVAFGHELLDYDWEEQFHAHSLGWVCAYDAEGLVGFVNVPWDGGSHAFIMDTVVSPRAQRRGIGTKLIAVAVEGARGAGCEWLHVDFEDHLRQFYFEACGFRPTDAGLIAL
jgi:GNAT superfamily N-acetyltransferase